MYIPEQRNIYILSIYYVYTMKKIDVKVINEIVVKNISAYFEKKVTKFGNGAKIDTPKEYIDKKVIVLVIER